MRLLLAGLALVAATPAAAQPLTFADRSFAEAVGYLLVVDDLRAACPEAARPPLSERLLVWETANRVAALRQAITAARADAQGDKVYRQLDAAMD